jgi:hypothetical protein
MNKEMSKAFYSRDLDRTRIEAVSEPSTPPVSILSEEMERQGQLIGEIQKVAGKIKERLSPILFVIPEGTAKNQARAQAPTSLSAVVQTHNDLLEGILDHFNGVMQCIDL